MYFQQRCLTILIKKKKRSHVIRLRGKHRKIVDIRFLALPFNLFFFFFFHTFLKTNFYFEIKVKIF